MRRFVIAMSCAIGALVGSETSAAATPVEWKSLDAKFDDSTIVDDSSIEKTDVTAFDMMSLSPAMADSALPAQFKLGGEVIHSAVVLPPVPEPGSMLLVGTGAAALFARRRRSQRNARPRVSRP